MSYITLKCKNCGANMSLNTESHSATCNHCGSTFLLGDLLDEKDAAFTEKFTPKNLEQKMMAQEAIKQGETFLFQAEFEKAEICFKRAIELDETNFRPYLGVVKAKTKNLNIIPEDDDYIQYANYSLSLAEGDDLLVVKNELAKIKVLKKEDLRQRKIKSSSVNQEGKNDKRGILKVTSIISVFILVMFCFFIFISSNLLSSVFSGIKPTKNIEIGSYEDLMTVFSDTKYLDYNISLSSDIDCGNKEITPFGTASKAFTGVFNGNKHKIYNAKIKTSDNGKTLQCIGLFGHTNLSKINNLILDGVSITIDNASQMENSSFVGLLVGKCNASTLNNIEVTEFCYISLNGNYEYELSVGGLVGAALNSTHIFSVSCHPSISLTSSQTLKSADSFVGSVVGLSKNSIIEKSCSNSSISMNCTNTYLITPTAYAGGIIGFIQNDDAANLTGISNNFFSGNIFCYASGESCKISAIAGSGLPTLSKQNNYCLFTYYGGITNFMLSGSNLLQTNLYDYNSNQYFVEFCYSYNAFMAEFTKIFSNWNNSNTYTPKLT